MLFVSAWIKPHLKQVLAALDGCEPKKENLFLESPFELCAYHFQFPRWLSGKESSCQAGDAGLILRLGRSTGEGNGNPLQYSCLGNPTDRGAWRATVHGVAELDTTLQLNNNNAKQNLSQCGFIHKTDKPWSIGCNLSEILRGSQIKCVRSTCCLSGIFIFNLPKRSKPT